MSRIITEKACNAFLNSKNFKLANTEVKNNAMYLHGNKIAWFEDDILYISLCGWNTPTTRERLNGLPNVNINVKKGKLFFNGIKINSKEVYNVAYFTKELKK